MICKRGHIQDAKTRCGDKCRVCQQLLQAQARKERRFTELAVWLGQALVRVRAIRKQVANAKSMAKRRKNDSRRSEEAFD